jgi:hypothetical protein
MYPYLRITRGNLARAYERTYVRVCEWMSVRKDEQKQSALTYFTHCF